MREGSIDAPTRHPIKWKDDEFWDEENLNSELERVFDICHGCRRCFNLCDSFPILFDMIDDAPSGELDTVDKGQYKKVVDACTLCDMCFLTKCPYVPPHEFNLDFPHLMVRARAIQLKKGEITPIEEKLTQTDKNGKLGCGFSSVANWASKRDNSITRPIMQTVLGIDKNAELPKFNATKFTKLAKKNPPNTNQDAPAKGRKVALYATCFAEYNNSEIGRAAHAVLAKNGVEVEVVYPVCCGMPQLEHGDLEQVEKNAIKASAALKPYIEKGYDIVAIVPSCALMLKFEWPLIAHNNADVKLLAQNSFDITEYMVNIAKNEGLAEGMTTVGDVTIHISCHSRAQNMGQKGAEMLRQIPDSKINVIERCSGHGGAWGVMKDNFDTALKIGKPVARKFAKMPTKNIVSECPLAREHILQGVEILNDGKKLEVTQSQHPIELIAKAYGI